jgi:hypothetical protein
MASLAIREIDRADSISMSWGLSIGLDTFAATNPDFQVGIISAAQYLP